LQTASIIPEFEIIILNTPKESKQKLHSQSIKEDEHNLIGACHKNKFKTTTEYEENTSTKVNMRGS